MVNRKEIDNLISLWQKRNITGLFCQDKLGALAKILEMIPQDKSIGLSGSVTLNELKVTEALEQRGNKVFNQFQPGISREESLRLRTQGANADYFLTSANAISQKGELVFLSAFSHRVVGISQAKNVIVVVGINKITKNLDAALSRAKNYATPLNCKRLNYVTPCYNTGKCHNDECVFPEYKRMCCQALILEAEMDIGRTRVVLVGESLGY